MTPSRVDPTPLFPAANDAHRTLAAARLQTKAPDYSKRIAAVIGFCFRSGTPEKVVRRQNSTGAFAKPYQLAVRTTSAAAYCDSVAILQKGPFLTVVKLDLRFSIRALFQQAALRPRIRATDGSGP